MTWEKQVCKILIINKPKVVLDKRLFQSDLSEEGCMNDINKEARVENSYERT
jgi:hypothetical protein